MSTSRDVPRDPVAEAEFARQFDESFRTLWLIAAGVVGDRSAADDVVQEAAVVALGKLDQFQPGTSFTAWMGQIVRFVALNYGRKERRRDGEPIGTRAVDLPAGRPATSLHLEPNGDLRSSQRVLDDRLTEAIKDLGEDARCCLLLRVVQGLEYGEIARILEIPEGTAMSHVHRARQQLKARLGSPKL